MYTKDGTEVVLIKWDDLVYLVSHTVQNTKREDFIRQIAEDFVVDESEVGLD